MTFRRSLSEDFERLLELSREFEFSPFAFDKRLKDISSSVYPAFAADMIKSPSSRTMVAEEESQIVGFITYGFNRPISQAIGKNIGSILLLSVDKAYRQKGVGKYLVFLALSELLGEGADIVTVGTDIYNLPAIRLYESRRFHIKMGWHIYRLYTNSLIKQLPNPSIIPFNYNALELFIPYINRPISLFKESEIDHQKLRNYLVENMRRSLLKGKSFAFQYIKNGQITGMIHITRDSIGEKTLQTDREVYKVLDVISLEDSNPLEIQCALLKDIPNRIENCCLLELWISADNDTLIQAAENAGFHLSYTGVTLHYSR